MNRSTALTLLICLSTLLPLQVTYADTISATKPSNTAEQAASSIPPTASTIVQATVTTLSEETAADLIQVTKSPLPLNSKLQKSYEAYRITVQSDYPRTLRLQSASVNNAQSGAMAYELVKSSMTPAYCTLFLGLAGFVLIGVPMLIVKNSHNDQSKQESLTFTNQIPLTELGKGEVLNFDTLVPLGQKPDVSLSFRDRQSGLLFSKRAL